MSANEILKHSVLKFWDKFGGWKPKGDYSQFNQQSKLAAIKEMAELKIPFKHQRPVELRRVEFDKNKAKLCRHKLGSPCFVCSCPSTDRHHIIQMQNGGINSRRNLIALCRKCHSQIHPWMKSL